MLSRWRRGQSPANGCPHPRETAEARAGGAAGCQSEALSVAVRDSKLSIRPATQLEAPSRKDVADLRKKVPRQPLSRGRTMCQREKDRWCQIRLLKSYA